MTARTITYSLLEYLGEFSLTLTEYTGPASTGVYRAVVRSFNEALDRLFELNPGLWKREVGVTVAAPESGTVTVSGSVVSATTLTGAMWGNTILIAGQSEHNAIRLEGATKKLLFPYTGAAGTQTATMYGDALLLNSAFSRPLGPVWLSDIRELIPLAGKSAFINYDFRQDLSSDWGLYPFGTGRYPQGRTIGQPEAFFIDTHLGESGATHQVRIFLSPMPDRVYSLRFDAGVRPLAVTTADIGTLDGDADPAREFGMPAGLDHGFLLPAVLYFWSRSAFFKNAEARQQIADDWAEIIPEIKAWTAQPQTGGQMVTRGWK